jgi:Cu(I)/Ag(I) efflux system membrane fusion protein
MALRPFYRAYLDLGAALASDDAAAAREAFGRVEAALHGLSGASIPAEDRIALSVRQASLHGAAVAGGNSTDLATAREAFRRLSEAAIALAREAGHDLDGALVIAFCPMVEGGGAAWLQAGAELANPFFGASMLRCGEIRERLPAGDAPAGERGAP